MADSRFIIVKEIGSGSFSVVHKATDLLTNRSVAIKMIKNDRLDLFKAETKGLNAVRTSECFPKLVWSGKFLGSYSIAMRYLGISASTLRKKRSFSIDEIAEVGIQITQALNDLHEADFLHRDLKLDNIVIDRKKKEKYYLIDLGLSKAYRDKKTKDPYPEKHNRLFRGNLMFCSSNVLNGVQASRRDDIISLFMILVFMIKNTLPWMNHCSNVNTMLCRRRVSSFQGLIEDVHPEIIECYKSAISLEFCDKPDYHWIISRLLGVKDCFGLIRLNDTFNRLGVNKKKKRKNVKSFQAVDSTNVNNSLECSTIKMLFPEFSDELKTRVKSWRASLGIT